MSLKTMAQLFIVLLLYIELTKYIEHALCTKTQDFGAVC